LGQFAVENRERCYQKNKTYVLEHHKGKKKKWERAQGAKERNARRYITKGKKGGVRERVHEGKNGVR